MKERNSGLIVSRKRKISGWEKLLGIKFPRTYRQFLLEREEIEKETGFELPVLGLATKENPMSVSEATEILRTNRPDLKDKPLICIRFIGNWAVCLDLREKLEKDLVICNR